ncbi:MAG: DoxX family protein [Saprospiraceae bacterium]|nr:DoxX family protein [Saprospiraceae bacterium]
MKMNSYVKWALRIVVAIILLQTLRFKFTAHPDSVYIFTRIGMEPLGRILIGVIELIAGILILIPRTTWMGAILALGVLSGAIVIHLTILGIDVKGDGGLLFYTAIFTWIMTVSLLFIERKNIPIIGEKL